MNINQFRKCIEFNIDHNLKHAVLGLGAPGVGKSELVKQIGEKYGYKVIDIRLAQMSEVEIGGLIYPNKERTKTVWLSPEILPDEERDGKNTILLLDEITSCPKRVQVAAYQLILDRRIGQYRLPEGTFVIGLGNREDDDGVYIELAGPLADRFEILYIEPDFSDWKYNYAVPTGVHPLVVRYLSFKPAALHTQNEDSGMRFATPRSWVRVSDILKCCADTEDLTVQRKIIGNVGEAEGTQFLQFCKKANKVITVDEYLGGRRAPEDVEELSFLTNGLIDRVVFIAERTGSLPQDEQKQLDDIILALFRLGNDEFTVIGIKELLKLNRSIVKNSFMSLDNPAFIRFIQNNKTLLGLT